MNIFALVGLLTIGTVALVMILLIQAVQLRDWRKRAIQAENECMRMHQLYGPHSTGIRNVATTQKSATSTQG